MRLYAPDLPLPEDAAEICDLVREGSPIARRLVDAIFDDDALLLRPGTYLNERAALGRLMDDARLVDDFDDALNALRQGHRSANHVLQALIDAYQSVTERPADDLWAAKAALEGLAVRLDLRRHVARQVTRLASRGDGVDAGLHLVFRAQTLELLRFLADACEAAEIGLLERMDLTEEERSAVSAALFMAYAERAAQLGAPLAVERVAAHVRPPFDLDGAARSRGTRLPQTAATALAALGVAQAVVPVHRIADPLLASAAIWQGSAIDLSQVARPWAAPAAEFPTWQYTGEAAPLLDRPYPQLQLALTTTGAYSFPQLAQYFGFRSTGAVQFLTEQNLELLAKVSPTAKTLPAGQTVVIPATLLPVAQVRSLEETATTFDIDVAALVRLNLSLVESRDGKPAVRSAAEGYLLTPVGRADLLGPETMTTRPLAFDVASGKPFTGAQTTAASSRPGEAVATSEMPTPRQRHVRLHHTLTQATTIAALADRLGLPAGALAEYNGLTDVGKALAAGTNVLLPGTVHRVVEGEDLALVATRYEVPGAAIEDLNGKLFVGQALFVPQPPSRLQAEGVFEARPSGSKAATGRPSSPSPGPTPQSLRQTGAASAPAAKASASITGATTASVFPDFVEMPGYLANWDQYKAKEAELKARYGQKLYPTLQAMPDDVREFYLTSVYWGAQLIGVPWQAVLAIHNTEVVGKGYRPFEQAVSFAAARGPGQITPGYWNGWAGSGRSAAPSKNFADIVKNNGNGFHWGLRAEWLRYLRHEVGLDALKSSDADIMYLINNVVATARGLYKNGVTTKAFPADPRQWSQANITALRNAVMIYNSGGTNPAVRQCSGCAWTVGDYANNAEKVAKALPASPFDLLPTEARGRALRQEVFISYDQTFAASLSAQQLQQALTAQADKVGDLMAGKRSPQEAGQAIVAGLVDGWLKVAERQPDAWPFFVNEQARDAQLAAARHLAAFLDKPTLMALLERTGGDVKAAEAELAGRLDAQVVQMARESLERRTPNRVVLNAQVRPLAVSVMQTVFGGNLDPGQPDAQARLDEARRMLDSGQVKPAPTVQTAAGGVSGNSGPAKVAAPTPATPARGVASAQPGAPTPGPTLAAATRALPLASLDVVPLAAVKPASGTTNGAAQAPAKSVLPRESTTANERFFRLSAQAKTSNNSIQNNIRLFAARMAGRTDEFRVAGSSRIDWARLQQADVSATLVLPPGEKLDYVARFGPFSSQQGYASGPLVSGGTAPGVGACQVATLFKAAALKVPSLKVWNGTKHPTIPGLNDVSAVSILSGSPRQNLQITNTGATPVTFYLRVVGDTATMRVEVGSPESSQKGRLEASASGIPPLVAAPPVDSVIPPLVAAPPADSVIPPLVAAPPPGVPAPTVNEPLHASSSALALGDRIVSGAADLIGKYAYGNMRDGPAQGYYVCTDVVNYAAAAAGVPIVENYKDAATVRWVGTHMNWFKGTNVKRMVNSRQREFKAAETLPQPGWVIFIRRDPYREASHEGIVRNVRVDGDRAVVTTLEALGGFKRDAFNKANNVQPTTYSYQRGDDGSWRQTGINKTNRIVGYGVVKG